MREQLERTADLIEWALWSRGVRARVAGGTIGPRLIRFYLLPAPGVRADRLVSLAEGLALDLNTPCRITRQAGQVVLELPHPNPPPVSLATLVAGLKDVPPETALLGLDGEGRVLGLRLSSPYVAHVLVGGLAGSGKTALLQTMALSLARQNSIAGLRLVLVGQELEALSTLPHILEMTHTDKPPKRVITEPDDIESILDLLLDMLKERDQSRQTHPQIIVIIDELADVANQEMLAQLVRWGQLAGLHVVAATQKPELLATGVLAQVKFPVRIVGQVNDAVQEQMIAGHEHLGVDQLLGKGDFLLMHGGQVVRFQGAYDEPDSIAAIVSAIRAIPAPQTSGLVQIPKASRRWSLL